MLEIRPFIETDSIAEMTALLHASHAELAKKGFNYSASYQSEEVTRENVMRGDCFIALKESKMVGMIIYFRTPHKQPCNWYKRPGVAYFDQFGILPEFQSMGIGRQLLSLAETKAKSDNATELAGDTAENAADLLNWYLKQGYRTVDSLQWPGKTYRSVVFSKTISLET